MTEQSLTSFIILTQPLRRSLWGTLLKSTYLFSFINMRKNRICFYNIYITHYISLTFLSVHILEEWVQEVYWIKRIIACRNHSIRIFHWQIRCFTGKLISCFQWEISCFQWEISCFVRKIRFFSQTRIKTTTNVISYFPRRTNQKRNQFKGKVNRLIE